MALEARWLLDLQQVCSLLFSTANNGLPNIPLNGSARSLSQTIERRRGWLVVDAALTRVGRREDRLGENKSCDTRPGEKKSD